MPTEPAQQNAADIAREAFYRLAERRIAPTPDAYRAVYDEIAGLPVQTDAETVLAGFAARLAAGTGAVAELGRQCVQASAQGNWQDFSEHLNRLLEQHLPPAATAIDAAPQSAPTLPPSVILTGAQGNLLRDMLVRALNVALTAQLQHAPQLMAEAQALAASIKEADSTDALSQTAGRLRQLCLHIEQDSEDMQHQQEMLLRLFRLLLDNVKDLAEEDSWLAGQIASVQALLAGPINSAALQDATRSLKEVIYQQGVLKQSLTDAKVTVKHMMLTFIECLSATAATTRDYHRKIEHYTTEISRTDDIGKLNTILHDVMRETLLLQSEALRSRDQMLQAQQEAQTADGRIKSLETQLAHMSEMVREDQLTGSLNRRGLDDVFERELARADRRGTPLCVAMLDLDDFKRINDSHGHAVGDEALIHLVRVIKDTLRTMDILARFGGEEFLILLPDTTLESASATVTRLQRELTKRIFLHNHQRILITFSAGLALRAAGEDRKSLLRRADAALYKAKKAGKNRVVNAG
ncbi:MAG TPA: GGDEF domain-containing protein [Burkholderiaceae bacterium]|nr:GGDEF domain-containing protein [Burkholderiaceae bacterium]